MLAISDSARRARAPFPKISYALLFLKISYP